MSVVHDIDNVYTLGRSMLELDAMFSPLFALDKQNDVVFFSIGTWYNLPLECDKSVLYFDQDSCGFNLQEKYFEFNETMFEEIKRLSGHDLDRFWYHLGKNRNMDHQLFSGQLRVQLLRFVKWIEINRLKLPDRMFWIESSPTHFDRYGTYLYPSEARKFNTSCTHVDKTLASFNWRQNLERKVNSSMFLERL